MKINDDTLNNWFSYHAPEKIAEGQGCATEAILQDFAEIRVQGLLLARAIRDNCPEGADTTAAIRKVREAVMTANASIACGGK